MSVARNIHVAGLAVLLSQHGQTDAMSAAWSFNGTAFDCVASDQLTAEEMFRLGDRETGPDRLLVLDPVPVTLFNNALPATGDRVTAPDGVVWRVVSVATLPGSHAARFIVSRT